MATIQRRAFSCADDAIAARRAELFIYRQGAYAWADGSRLQIGSLVNGGVLRVRDMINRQGGNERHIRLIGNGDVLIVTLVYDPDGLLTRTF